jgi:hypothetical protein
MRPARWKSPESTAAAAADSRASEPVAQAAAVRLDALPCCGSRLKKRWSLQEEVSLCRAWNETFLALY